MERFILYNNDIPAATFTRENGAIASFTPIKDALLPMQLCHATAEGFTLWLSERAIDLNVLQHRMLAQQLYKSRDKITLSLLTHMLSLLDTFTCFPENTFQARESLFNAQNQAEINSFILLSSEIPLRQANFATPNIATDGSFTKTWVYEDGAWWLYKLQSALATQTEVSISNVLQKCAWDGAIYRYKASYRKRVRSKNFVGKDEFFEPYASLRYMFKDISDDDATIFRNIASLGKPYLSAWKKILAADALFYNTDRHMRNFGVIRCAKTGEILRLAPNFDNNQAYTANPSGKYSTYLLRQFLQNADAEDRENLQILTNAIEDVPFLAQAFEAAKTFYPR